MEKRLIVIDSNALLHRAFHALPPLKTKSGQETGAVYGYLLTLFKAKMLLKLILASLLQIRSTKSALHPLCFIKKLMKLFVLIR